MALKCFLFVSLLLVIASTAPLSAEAQLSSIISGLVPCTNLTTNLTATLNGFLPFPNAVVVAVCGTLPIATAVTNSSGFFQFLPILLPTTTVSLQNCTVVVKTSLSACNPSIPSLGVLLASPLQLVANTTQAIWRTVGFATTSAFNFLLS